jgi:ribonuclease-3 family protein
MKIISVADIRGNGNEPNRNNAVSGNETARNSDRGQRAALSEKEAGLLNPLWLAFVGDAVWQYNIRAVLLGGNPENILRASEMHKIATGYECASFQSELFISIEPYLTEQERDLVKRARNSHNNNVPKSTTLSGYKRATALESLIGYWYLCGDQKKIEGLVNIAEKTGGKNKC